MKSKSGIVFILLVLATSGVVPAQTGTLDPPLTLEVDSRYVGSTASSTFTLTGPPGAKYKLEGADVPAETVTPWGTYFLERNSFVVEASGVLSELGEATVVIAHPVERVDGTLRYYQGRSKAGQQLGLSNSIAVRFGATPVGKRKPEAIAATADGKTAYVGHALDGTLSILDATTDTLLFNMPVTNEPPLAASQPLTLAIDPEGRHLFVVNPLLPTIAVIDIASASIVGQLPVPTSSRSVSFNFSGSRRWLQVTNEGARALLMFQERPLGRFRALPSVLLEGEGPGPAVVLPSKQVLVGHRGSLELELVSLTAPTPTIARIPLGSPPIDIVTAGDRVFVSTFTTTAPNGDGNNELLEIDMVSHQVIGSHLVDHGTDYFDALISDNHVVVIGSGSGTVVIGDPVDLTLQEIVDLAPGEPTAVPSSAAIVPDPITGEPDKLYVVNLFRETVRPIDLSSGPPFQTLPEIALAYSGGPRVPLTDLSDVENGEWFFNSVEFFNGTATTPNPVTCATCHPRAFSDNVAHDGVQCQELFDTGATGPWRFNGGTPSIEKFVGQAFNTHGAIGGEITLEAREFTSRYQESAIPAPLSPFLEPDGSLSPAAEAGKIVFDGVAGCATCHTAPLFIPTDPANLTIDAGVGTGLVPANVPSLRGKWASGPHLHDGSAPILMDVLLTNVGDLHGTTSTLTQQQLDDLVAYLMSL